MRIASLSPSLSLSLSLSLFLSLSIPPPLFLCMLYLPYSPFSPTPSFPPPSLPLPSPFLPFFSLLMPTTPFPFSSLLFEIGSQVVQAGQTLYIADDHFALTEDINKTDPSKKLLCPEKMQALGAYKVLLSKCAV